MIIEELKLTNWGRHREITFNCNANSAGVLGPNGSGKSTVLAAVEFLITGEAKDPLETYVRNNDGNATCFMRFRKYGKQGTIFRQVGKTSKRELVWDGQPSIKSAKEVDAMMATIFGNDKRALANSVFVNQGTMEDVLFRTDGRRKAFIRLVNLAFCEKNVRVVERQINTLLSGMVDLGPARDEALTARNGAAEQLRLRSEELAQYPDWSAALEHANSLSKHASEHNTLTEQLGVLSTNLGIERQKLQGRLPAGVSYESFEARVHKASENASSERQKLNEFQSILTELVHYRRVQGEIAEHRNRIIEFDQLIKDINPDGYTLETINGFISKLELELQTHRKLSNAKHRHGEQIQLKNKAATELEALGPVKAEHRPEALQQLQDHLTQQEVSVQQLQKWKEMQDTIAATIQTATDESTPAECPKCGLMLLNRFALSPESLVELHKNLQDGEQIVKYLRKQLSDTREAEARYSSAYSRISGSVRVYEAEITKLQNEIAGYVVTGSEQGCTEDLQAWRNIAIQLKGHQSSKQQHVGEQTKKLAALGSYKLAQKHWETRDQYTVTVQAEKIKVVEQLESTANNSQQQLVILSGIRGQIKQLEQESQTKNSRLEALIVLMNPVEVPAIYTEQRLACGDNMIQLHATLTAHELERNNRQIGYNYANEQYQTANTRYQEIETRIEANKAKQQLVAELQELRSLLSDDGIPMKFVMHKFGILAKHTQDSLASMNADFFISINPDRELEFSFHRLDDLTKVELPMSKLSGGQKVRLCVSFLMALQKTLIKEIGLLVLDEPSVHVDVQGREEMAAFFKNMRSELQNTDHQIWVVDHCPIIGGSLEKLLQL